MNETVGRRGRTACRPRQRAGAVVVALALVAYSVVPVLSAQDATRHAAPEAPEAERLRLENVEDLSEALANDVLELSVAVWGRDAAGRREWARGTAEARLKKPERGPFQFTAFKVTKLDSQVADTDLFSEVAVPAGRDETVAAIDVTWPDGSLERFAGPFQAGSAVRRREMPELEAMRERLASAGIDLVGLNVDTAPGAEVAAFAGERVRYPVVRLEPSTMARLYATDEVVVPLSLLVEADGRLAELVPGWSDATRRRLEQHAGGVAPQPSPTEAPAQQQRPHAAPPAPVHSPAAPDERRPSDPPPPATQPAPAAPATQDEGPAYRISGLVYGDYYYVAHSHRDGLEDQNGFWLRRIYFTYDHTLTRELALRVRLEVNSRGDFQSTGVSNAYLKDAYLRWTRGAHALSFGMASTPNIEFVEAFQGYRSVEKTPLDLYRWDGSRDLGLLAQGGLGAERRTRYSLQFGNGSGTGSETDASKTVRGQLIHRFARGLVLESYADWQDRPDGRDFSTLEAFAGWDAKAFRASLQYASQRRRKAAPDGSDLTLDVLSAFGAWQAAKALTLVARVDRNFDPIPGGDTIDYMPFAETAKSTFALVGVDLTLARNVHLIPNVEMTFYDQPVAGVATPGSDLVPRVTLFFTW